MALAGCANIGAPPGGPLRTEPPRIVAVAPESGSVNVRADRVVFDFDAVVSDRPAGQASLDALFLISPRDGAPRVRWERDRIVVRPRGDFRPNTAYAVTLLPGLADLRGNTSTESRTVVFSTGPVIPPHAVHGRVFDWMNERPAIGAVVEVLRLPDSTLYVGSADSTGRFSVGPLEEGAYIARAFIDNNRNRGLDPSEAWDSAAVIVRGASVALELLAAPRDTAGPRLLTVEVRDSVTLALSFDRPLDPAVPLTPASFRILDADSSRLVVARALAREPVAADTTGAPALRDSLRVAALPRPSQPAPTLRVILVLDAASALRAGALYRVVAVNLRGLRGAVRTSEREITVDELAPQPDPVPEPARLP